jgi:hypothetical protein
VTILAGARSRGAIVIGADSQESSGATRRTTQKLLRPQPGLLIAWAGFRDVAQAFAISMREEPLDLSGNRSVVAKAAKERFRLIREDSDVADRSETNEFMLGWFSHVEAKPVAFHLHPQGRVVWVEDWEYAGSSLAVATARTVEASLSYLVTENLGAEQLSLVVLKVLRDSITAAGPTAVIGGEVQLAEVTKAGVHVLDAAELRAANDALDVWHGRCAELLPSGGAMPPDEPSVDRGLRPPF